ncbi:hypothetical protein AB0E77_16915 [Streptomyces sp. NPDC032940]|uniref:hypothetical protein n=1 Tax=Streptomyces sp. NPDC032940 TaxID=3155366 RepID=UPI0033DA26D9
MTVSGAGSGLREHAGYWIGTVPVRLLAVAAVTAAWRPWATVDRAGSAVLFGCAVLFAWWAAPAVDRRPSLGPARRAYGLVRHRTTVLACGVVVMAANGEPARWEGAGVAVLLVAYLVASEAWPWRGGRGIARVWAEALGACAGAGMVLAAAAAPMTGVGSGGGRVLAASVVVGMLVAGGAVVRAWWRADDR